MSLRNRTLGLCSLFGFLQLGCSADTGTVAEGDAAEQQVSLASEFEVRALEGVPFGSAARAINAKGQVIGNSVDGGNSRAFVWQDGRAIDLGTLGGWYTYAWDINDEGVIVGISETVREQRFPFVWKDGVMTALYDHPSEPHEGVAYGINNEGQVVGQLYAKQDAEGARAFSWREGAFTPLPVPAAQNWLGSTAWDVNEDGEIVGEGQREQGGVAVLWSSGGTAALQTSANSQSEAALAINNFGVIVGRNTDREDGRRATSWSPEGVEYLGFGSAMASAVNDAGVIVGKHAMTTTTRRAFIQGDGVAIDLHAVTRDNPYQNSEATDVDAAGRVVGAAFRNGLSWAEAEAVIWTPVEASAVVR
jgi:probable HAF family extracellular repeat protein